MRFPLDYKAIGGYRFQEYTFYNTYHTGTDWVANFVSLYAPVSGSIIATPWDYGGGQWVNFRGDDGSLHLFAHLSAVRPLGRYNEGQQIGVTGNTGGYTTGPHLHEQIYINGSLINPEGYYEGEVMATTDEIAAIGVRLDNVGNAITGLRADVNSLASRMDNVGNENVAQNNRDNELKAQMDRIETTLAKVLSDEVLQEAKIDGIKVGPQKGFWELLTDWVNGFKK